MDSSLLALLNGQNLTQLPIWYMRQAGRYLPEYLKLRKDQPDFVQFCLTPALCIEAAHQPLRRFDLDAAILFADILLLPQQLGQKVWFEKGAGPQLEPISFPAFFDNPKRQENFLDPIYKTIKGLKKTLPANKPLIGFAGAPWTVACYMLAGGSQPSQDTARTFMYQHPQHFRRLLDILTEGTADYLCKQIDAGADVIQLFDSWSGVLSAESFDQAVIEPTARIVARIKAHAPAVPVIGFPRGCGTLALPFVEQTGVRALSVDSNQPFSFLRQIQKLVPLQGNLDPMLAVVGGEPMFAGAKKIIEELSEGGLIFGLGHGIVPQTPPDNIKALTEFVRAQ